MSIREIREAANLTRQQLSELLHIPYRTIQDWECGNRQPPEYILELIEYRLTH